MIIVDFDFISLFEFSASFLDNLIGSRVDFAFIPPHHNKIGLAPDIRHVVEIDICNSDTDVSVFGFENLDTEHLLGFHEVLAKNN